MNKNYRAKDVKVKNGISLNQAVDEITTLLICRYSIKDAERIARLTHERIISKQKILREKYGEL